MKLSLSDMRFWLRDCERRLEINHNVGKGIERQIEYWKELIKAEESK